MAEGLKTINSSPPVNHVLVYEPLCRGHSHEVFNAGFVELFRQAYPAAILEFHAEPTHLDCVMAALPSATATSDDVHFVPAQNRGCGSKHRTFGFLRMFRTARTWRLLPTTQVAVLSFDPVLLLAIKIAFIFDAAPARPPVLVLHGVLESARTVGSSGRSGTNPRDIPAPSSRMILRELCNALSTIAWTRRLPQKRIKKLLRLSKQLIQRPTQRFQPTLRRAMHFRDDPDLKYIVLSDHILANIPLMTDLNAERIYSLPLPRIMQECDFQGIRRPLRLAVFGYGNPQILEDLLQSLAEMSTDAQYKIVLITGYASQKLARFPNVVLPTQSGSAPLTRDVMDEMMKDADAQIILYPDSFYELSCSGSIFEAFAYRKPVIHLSNSCINYYNTVESPIGYRFEDVSRLAEAIIRIAESPSSYEADFESFRRNIDRLRSVFGIGESTHRVHRICGLSG